MRGGLAMLQAVWAALQTPADEADCYGCFLDRQWVGSGTQDHTCKRCLTEADRNSARDRRLLLTIWAVCFCVIAAAIVGRMP